MCKVYNQIGSLTAIKTHLRRNNVNEFSSLNGLLIFQQNYFSTKQEIISHHSVLIENEKDALKPEIEQLEQDIELSRNEYTQKLQLELEQLQQQLEALLLPQSNIIKKIVNYFKRKDLKRKIQDFELYFDSRVSYSIQHTANAFINKNTRYDYILSNFSDAVYQSGRSELDELERKKNVIEQVTNSIYGAIGENKVVKELANLSDDYILINDFVYSFYPPIYNRQGDDYIKSVQIDHILISPSGIFIIETKNWSEYSMNNVSLRSPVEQTRRASLALYRLLANKSGLIDQHHWGERKIPIRNLIVLINQKPKEEFQYVKVLTLKELRNYVEYFSPSFSVKDVEMIADYLLRKNESRN